MNAPRTPQIPLLELDMLRTIVTIAETGNFSAAAGVLLRTPSAISMQVKKVEDLLGRPVFTRDSRHVTLTGDGMALVEHGRRMLALNRDMMGRFVTPDLRGEVRLGAPDDVAERFLPDMLRRFAETHCCIGISVVVEGSQRLIDMVRSNQLDMALITAEAGFEGDNAAEVVYHEQLVWGTRRGGIAAEQEPIPLSVWEEGCVWRQAGLEGLKKQNRAYRVAFQSAHISGQRAAILADLAIAPIPVSSLGGEIVAAKPEHNLPALPKYALGLMLGADPTPPTSAAADHLRASFAKRAETPAAA